MKAPRRAGRGGNAAGTAAGVGPKRRGASGSGAHDAVDGSFQPGDAEGEDGDDEGEDTDFGGTEGEDGPADPPVGLQEGPVGPWPDAPPLRWDAQRGVIVVGDVPAPEDLDPWPEGEGPGEKPEFDDDGPAGRKRVARRPVRVTVQNLPAALPPADLRSLVGYDDLALQQMSPIDAAVLVRTLDGVHIGGSTLSVEVELDEWERLPRVPRDRRFDRSTWDRRGPWLRHVDAEGRRSLTPEPLARRMATLLRERGVDHVVEAFAGCGGNTVAFAEAGLSADAFEIDPERAELLRRNLKDRRVHRQVRVEVGDAGTHLKSLLRQEGRLALFLDPPWGGTATRSTTTALGELLSDTVREAMAIAPTVLLKLPRGIDLRTLPERRWTFGSWAPGRNPHGGYLPTVIWGVG